MKHNIPLGTKITFEGDLDHYVYETCDYQDLLMCEKDCKEDHDCFPEPHVSVRRWIATSMPYSKIKYIFDLPDGKGREFTP